MLLFYYNPYFTHDPSKELLFENIVVGRAKYLFVFVTHDSTVDTQSEENVKKKNASH